MATAHVYVRCQVKGSNEAVESVAAAASALQAAVEAAGGAWCGSANVELDEAPKPEPEPVEPVTESQPEADAPAIPADDPVL